MFQIARLWKGAGPWTLGGLLLSGALARGADEPPLTTQLLDLGRQALAQGHPREARDFFRQVLKLDPDNADARKALAENPALRRVALGQDPADEPKPVPEAETPQDQPPAQEAQPTPETETPPAAQPGAPPATATIERAAELERVYTEQLTADVRDRQQRARELINQGQPEAALESLRLALSAIRSDDRVPVDVRNQLEREVQVQYRDTVRRQEEYELNRSEALRQRAMAEQTARALAEIQNTQESANLLMTQFDTLMAEGTYNVLANGGLGDIQKSTAPYYEARLTAQRARSLEPMATAPRAGVFTSQSVAFLAQELMFEELKRYRTMLSWQDVDRASVPFPDIQAIEYPPVEFFAAISDTANPKSRVNRYGRAVDLLYRDEKTQAILQKLDQPIPINYPDETPLEDVLKYIKSATADANMPNGIPIYVDPVGLNDADKTMQSPITLDLDGVPLKTTLRLLLKQLNLTYTVKDGLMTITSETSEDTPTEIRVYPVADLALIPITLMGGGGMMGGMGGMGMGGMGMMGGMGGMGMGGGMMGGMGGMGMGMMSLPPQDPSTIDNPPSPFLQKKSN